MDEPRDACPLGLARQPFGRPHMHGMKGLSSAFPVEADGIHDAIASGDSRRNLAFVVDIGAYPLKAFGGRQPAGRPGGDTRFEPMAQKMVRNAVPEKSCSAKHRHNLPGHRKIRSRQQHEPLPVRSIRFWHMGRAVSFAAGPAKRAVQAQWLRTLIWACGTPPRSRWKPAPLRWTRELWSPPSK